MVNVNFSPFPLINTDRFVLRALRSEDAKELFLLRTDPRINEYIFRNPPSSIEDVYSFIDIIMENTQRGNSILWAICPVNEEVLVGTICLWKISVAEAKAEIGYELLPQHHGMGIMQEVIPSVIEFGFDNIGVTTIEAESHRDNIKSLKLLEKNGFLRDEQAISDHADMIIYKLSSVAR